MEISTVSKGSLELLKGKAKVVGEIAIDSAMKQIGNGDTMSFSLGVGLMHGLFCGSLKRGIKTSLVILGVCVGANIVSNVANNWDEIKKR